MLRKLIPWLLFIACLALFAISGSSIGLLADRLFIAVRFSIVIILSILLIRDKLIHRSDSHRETFLRSLTRWSRGESKPH